MNSLFTVGRAGHGAGSDGYGTVIYTYSDHLSAWGPPRNLLRADSTRPGILILYYKISTGKGLTLTGRLLLWNNKHLIVVPRLSFISHHLLG